MGTERQIKSFILLIIAILVPRAGLTEDAIGSIQISGGRPLHQARDFNRDLQDIQKKYTYMRCVDFQLEKHFGSSDYNDQEQILPVEMHGLLRLAKDNLDYLTRQRDYLLQHHKNTDNDNISWENQQSISGFKKDINEFQSDFNKLFDKVTKSAAGHGKTRLCDRVLTRRQ